MRRALITLLVVITLLAQWGWLEHDYHEHLSDEVCEVCVSTAGHVAIPPSAPRPPILAESDFIAPAINASLAVTAPRFYSTRAPPLFL